MLLITLFYQSNLKNLRKCHDFFSVFSVLKSIKIIICKFKRSYFIKYDNQKYHIKIFDFNFVPNFYFKFLDT